MSSKVLWASGITFSHGLLLFALLNPVDTIPHRRTEVGASFILFANITDSTMDGRLDASPARQSSSESAAAELPELSPVTPPAAISAAAIETTSFSQAEPGEQTASPSLPASIVYCACPPATVQSTETCRLPPDQQACPKPTGA